MFVFVTVLADILLLFVSLKFDVWKAFFVRFYFLRINLRKIFLGILDNANITPKFFDFENFYTNIMHFSLDFRLKVIDTTCQNF